MKNSVILIFSILLISCNHTDSKTTEKREQLSNKHIEMDNENLEIQSISPKLLEIINEMISFYDDYNKEKDIKPNIFIINFYQVNEECYIKIVQHLYYATRDLKGYEIVKDRLIVFYNPEYKCNYELVNLTKLRMDTIDDIFPNEKSEIASKYIFETSGRIYKIHSKDSLELTFTGYI